MKTCKRTIRLRDVFVYWQCKLSDTDTLDVIFSIAREFRKKNLHAVFFKDESKGNFIFFAVDDAVTALLARRVQESITKKTTLVHLFNSAYKP